MVPLRKSAHTLSQQSQRVEIDLQVQNGLANELKTNENKRISSRKSGKSTTYKR